MFVILVQITFPDCISRKRNLGFTRFYYNEYIKKLDNKKKSYLLCFNACFMNNFELKLFQWDCFLLFFCILSSNSLSSFSYGLEGLDSSKGVLQTQHMFSNSIKDLTQLSQ